MYSYCIFSVRMGFEYQSSFYPSCVRFVFALYSDCMKRYSYKTDIVRVLCPHSNRIGCLSHRVSVLSLSSIAYCIDIVFVLERVGY